MELESLLSSVALRYRSLKADYDCLEDRKHQKTFSSEKTPSSPSTSSNKRKRDDKKSSKDFSHYGQKHSRIKSSLSSYSPAHSQNTDDSNIEIVPYTHSSGNGIHSNPKINIPKNDIPNKFWLSVEPYCMPITQEDNKMLIELIDEYVEPLVPSIPELGPNFAMRWTMNDLQDEQNSSSSKSNKRGSTQQLQQQQSIINETKATVNKMDNENDEKRLGEGICGPLTQRLVTALLDEQSDVIGSTDGTAAITNDSSDSCAENQSQTTAATTAITSLLKSGIDVEKRLQKELLELGILDASDFPKEEEDEVLNEIKRVRTELHAIAQYNLSELKLLKQAAKEEMKRLDVKRKLDRVDQEVSEKIVYILIV